MVRLTREESWARLEAAHTGIVTTLRSDGMPISLPVWFVVDGQTVVFSSPQVAKKVSRLRRDPRASFLVEAGEAWVELAGVHLTGTVELVEEPAEVARLKALIDAKYAGFRARPSVVPTAAAARYADKAYMRLVPDERILSWDNTKLVNR